VVYLCNNGWSASSEQCQIAGVGLQLLDLRALILERVNAGLAAAARRGKRGGRPCAVEGEKLEQIIAALDNGASKAAVCRSFKPQYFD
jgi:hypothetical protein